MHSIGNTFESENGKVHSVANGSVDLEPTSSSEGSDATKTHSTCNRIIEDKNFEQSHLIKKKYLSSNFVFSETVCKYKNYLVMWQTSIYNYLYKINMSGWMCFRLSRRTCFSGIAAKRTS